MLILCISHDFSGCRGVGFLNRIEKEKKALVRAISQCFFVRGIVDELR